MTNGANWTQGQKQADSTTGDIPAKRRGGWAALSPPGEQVWAVETDWGEDWLIVWEWQEVMCSAEREKPVTVGKP